jgi:hypothetical protein
MQGAQNLRSEAYLPLRCNDEGEAQRRRWAFYEAISFGKILIILLANLRSDGVWPAK